MKRVAVLASGRGSNLAALIAAESLYGSYRVTLVVSNVEAAGALTLAAGAHVPAVCIPSRGRVRELHDQAMLEQLHRSGVDLICLAGYMRVLGPAFVVAAGVPILNIHPSLLPSFPGLHAQRQAVESGVRISGATVHFVDAGLDTGPVLLQEAVPVRSDDTEETLSARILEVEHRLYPRAVDIVSRGRYDIEGRRVHLRS